MCLAQVEQARKLDRRQKEVLGIALHYARRVFKTIVLPSKDLQVILIY